ncbi:MAG: protein kinase [Planctomycetes bacterium]|nr:protein kinase [Planctomycetota bacterium]
MEAQGHIEHYAILGELARGGMGVIYRAHDTRMGRDVALKVLSASSSQQRARFLREVDSLMRLRHRYVVAAHAGGEFEGKPYLILDLVDGESLEARIEREGPLAPGVAVSLIRKLAQAIEYAHSQGVLHRDVKPANILMDAEGEPRLADFGLAKLLDGDQDSLTRTGMAYGTPGYWAPEQAGGKLAEIGPATDVYGLGATLYATLTGDTPVKGDSYMELLIATREQRPQRPGIDRKLDAICLRCLEKDPADRYASAGEVERDLLDWEEVGPGGRGLVLTLVALVVLASILVLTLAAIWTGRDAPASADSASPLATATVSSATAIPSPTPSSHAEAPAVEEEPTTVAGWCARADEWEAKGDHDRAIQALDRAIALRPGDARSLNSRAWNRNGLGDSEGALKDYTAALLSDPNYTGAWIRRGSIYFGLARYDEALRDVERALQLDPQSAKAYAHRGRIRMTLLKHESALEDFNRALELDPANRMAKSSRGVILQGQGDVLGGSEQLGESLYKVPKKEYTRPRRLTGIAQLMHDLAGGFESKTTHVQVTKSSPGMIGAVFAPLGPEAVKDSQRGLRQLWVVVGRLRTGAGFSSVCLFAYQDEAGARRMVALERELLEERGKQLEAATMKDGKCTASLSDYPGAPRASGFRFRIVYDSPAERAVSFSTILQVGPYCLEMVHANLPWTQAQADAFSERVSATVRASLR